MVATGRPLRNVPVGQLERTETCTKGKLVGSIGVDCHRDGRSVPGKVQLPSGRIDVRISS